MSLKGERGRRILARFAAAQNGLCLYCKRAFTVDGPGRPTIEHRKARMDGGSDRIANLAAACFHCNQHRGKQKLKARQRPRAGSAGQSPPA